MVRKIYWGKGGASNMGHLDGFNGFIERIRYDDGNFSYMVSTPIRTYLKVSEQYATLAEMEDQAIRFLVEKGELHD